MPFYLRKSISAGPFRFNFSRGGVGVSVGVRGLRIGTGPRGHYIHAGRGGVYYRASLGRAGQKQNPQLPAGQEVYPPLPPVSSEREASVAMVEIASGDALGMRDVRFAELLDEINAAQAKVPKAQTFGGLGIVLAIVLLLLGSAQAGAAGLIVALIGWAAGAWLDSYQRASVLFYELDDAAAASYGALTKAFDALVDCRGAWHIQAKGDIYDVTTWKRNAGASSLVHKKPAGLSYTLPKVMKSNVTPPCFHLSDRSLYFLPDAVFMVQGRKVGAVAYANLRAASEPSRFIEDSAAPTDATIVGRARQHPNKSGGPDRRFASNRQIPICLYDALLLQSVDGLNEQVQFSRQDASRPFAGAVEEIAWQIGAAKLPAEDGVLAPAFAAIPAPPLLPAPVEAPARRFSFGRWVTIALVGGFAGTNLIRMMGEDGRPPAPARPAPSTAVQAARPAPPPQQLQAAKPASQKTAAQPKAIAPTPAATPVAPSQSFYTRVGVNMRAGPSTDHPVVSGVPAGTAVTSSAVENGWRKVTTPLGEGWIRGDLLSEGMAPPSSPTSSSLGSPAPTPDPDPTAPSSSAPSSPPRPASQLPPPRAVPPAALYNPGPARSAPQTRARSGAPSRMPDVGTCDCPYDRKRNGALCGASSAYSRPGGRNPVCYD